MVQTLHQAESMTEGVRFSQLMRIIGLKFVLKVYFLKNKQVIISTRTDFLRKQGIINQ